MQYGSQCIAKAFRDLTAFIQSRCLRLLTIPRHTSIVRNRYDLLSMLNDGLFQVNKKSRGDIISFCAFCALLGCTQRLIAQLTYHYYPALLTEV